MKFWGQESTGRCLLQKSQFFEKKKNKIWLLHFQRVVKMGRPVKKIMKSILFWTDLKRMKSEIFRCVLSFESMDRSTARDFTVLLIDSFSEISTTEVTLVSGDWQAESDATGMVWTCLITVITYHLYGNLGCQISKDGIQNYIDRFLGKNPHTPRKLSYFVNSHSFEQSKN